MTELLQKMQEITFQPGPATEQTAVEVRAEVEVQTEIEVQTGVDVGKWNRYAAGRAGGSLFHRAEWEQVYATYGLEMIRLAALRNGRVVGVLPLVWQRSLLFGRQLVSLPWFDAAGVLADDETVSAALVEAAQRTADGHRNAVLQLRQMEASSVSRHLRTDKVLMRLQLVSDAQTLWNGFKPTVRNQVRKAEKSGLTVRRSGGAALKDFYRVYSQNMRDLGSPPHRRSLFERVLHTFPCESCIYTVHLEGRVVGAGLTMANGKRLEIPWASSLRKYNPFCVNHLMYWQILQDACRDGFEWFHFGRSTRDSGTYRFKKQWGAEPVPLYWYYCSHDERRLSSLMSPEESFGWGQKLWRRLPVTLARLIGPYVISRVP